MNFKGSSPKSENITEVEHLVAGEQRARLKGHKGGGFWLTGLSASGKSTLAMSIERELTKLGFHVYVLDGDNVRRGLNADLGFAPEDRTENIRRIGEVAALMADAGLIVITAFISPYREDRDRARKASADKFHELYVAADIETCKKRDPKGLYKKAFAGEIKEFTGIDAPYEAPENPELKLNTGQDDIETCVSQAVDYVKASVALDKS